MALINDRQTIDTVAQQKRRNAAGDYIPINTRDKQKHLPEPKVTPRNAIGDALVDSRGYDPVKADELAGLLEANASRTPGIGAPNVGSATGSSAPAPEMTSPDELYLDDVGLDDVNTTGVGVGDTGVTTRDVTPDELVENRLEGLVSGDSRYIRNARMRGLELANARGQLGSSFAAGAAERAAIESALPIAEADAQAYRDAATQNMDALNQMALAHLQRATQMDVAVLDSNTSRNMANLDAGVRSMIANMDAMTKINIANLDADTRIKLGNLQSKTQLAVQTMVGEQQAWLQGQQLTHDAAMEQLRQEGRVDLALMDADLKERLAHLEIDGNIELQNLSHEQRLDLERQINDYAIEKQDKSNSFERRTQHANLAMQAQINYTNYVSAYADTKMNKDAAARLRQDAWNKLQAELQMINGLYPEFDPITATKETQTVSP